LLGPAPGSHQAERDNDDPVSRIGNNARCAGERRGSVYHQLAGLADPNDTAVGGLERRAETATTAEAWPICTTMASVASDADWAQLDPDFKAGKKALRAENWKGAIAAFEFAALRDPTNADIQNYIGYAYRRLRQMGPAIGHYQKALMLNSRHRRAHGHLGEAYLVLGEPAKAQQQLAALEILCLIPCEEYEDLKRAIAAYGRLATR
jgi:Flp pilus assembly protein TadD